MGSAQGVQGHGERVDEVGAAGVQGRLLRVVRGAWVMPGRMRVALFVVVLAMPGPVELLPALLALASCLPPPYPPSPAPWPCVATPWCQSCPLGCPTRSVPCPYGRALACLVPCKGGLEVKGARKFVIHSALQ